MGLPLMHLSRITTWKLSLTRLSSCHISQQPPSSAKSSFLLACKSVPILPCDPFSFRPLLCLTYTVFVASLCSLSPLFAPLLSLSSIPSTHSWCYCQSDFSKKKKKKELPLLYRHPFNGFHHLLCKFRDSQHFIQGALWSSFSSPLWCHDCHPTFHTWIH